MSGHRTLFFAWMTALALCAAACTNEPAVVTVPGDTSDVTSQFDTAGTDPTLDTSPDPVYLQCPDGWQPNSTGEACAPICAAGTELNETETGCVPVEAPPDPDVTSTPDVVQPSDAPGPTPDVTTPE